MKCDDEEESTGGNDTTVYFREYCTECNEYAPQIEWKCYEDIEHETKRIICFNCLFLHMHRPYVMIGGGR